MTIQNKSSEDSMKKFGKIMVALLALACLVGACFAFTACNNNEENVNKLIVATNCEFDPFEYIGDDGNPTGIDMDIAKALADKLGWELEIKDMAFESVVASVASGTCNIAMAGLTVDEERKESLDFTQTYFSSSQVVIAKNGEAVLDVTYEEGATQEETDANLAAAIAEIESMLAGKRIGVQNGTTGYKYISGDSDDYDGIPGAQAIGYASGALAVQALLNGQVDYVVIDAVPAAKLVAANNGISASTVVLTGEDYAFGVKKGNKELLDKVNAALTELIEDGDIEAIFNKYGVSSGLDA